MYHVNAQGIYEHMINVQYYYLAIDWLAQTVQQIIVNPSSHQPQDLVTRWKLKSRLP